MPRQDKKNKYGAGGNINNNKSLNKLLVQPSAPPIANGNNVDKFFHQLNGGGGVGSLSSPSATTTTNHRHHNIIPTTTNGGISSSSTTFTRNNTNGLLLLSAQKKSGAGTSLFSTNSNNHRHHLNGGSNNGITKNGWGTTSDGYSFTMGSSVSNPTGTHHHHILTSSSSNSNLSTHDALLSAVRGASELREQHNPVLPDAWGTQQQLYHQNHQQRPITPIAVAVDESQQQFGYPEDSSRIREQKGKAVATSSSPSTRLRLLEEKMSKAPTPTQGLVATTVIQPMALNGVGRVAGESSTASPTTTPTSVWGGAGVGIRGVGTTTTTTTTRAIWEPSSPHLDETRKLEVNTGSVTATDSEPATLSSSAQSNASASSSYSGAVIHLSSYEDRDRGEQRNASSTPRMLYDPKSGSMVAVKARDENNNNNNHINTSSSRKKDRNGRKNRNKERDHVLVNGSKVGDAGAAAATTNSSSRKPKNGQRPSSSSEDTHHHHSGGNSSKSENSSIISGSGKWKNNKFNPRRQFPRTRGVLYGHDEKANAVCVDGCEGDLGYGCHTVPGGRTRNTAAYTSYLKHQEEVRTKESGGHQRAVVELSSRDSEGDLGALYTGFLHQAHEGKDSNAVSVEWVKADDKIELVTGIDDSPTLKPTAKEFAPSQAALAAAAAAAAAKAAAAATVTVLNRDRSIDSEDVVDDLPSCEEEAEEEDEDEEQQEDVIVNHGQLSGLGFDPTEDMDDLILSPGQAALDRDGLGSVDLNALGLDPPMFGGEEIGLGGTSSKATPRHIFAFGSSGTWGVGESVTSSTDDWNVPSLPSTTNGHHGGLFGVVAGGNGAEIFGKGTGEGTTAADSTSFLNIPPIHSWSSP